MEISRDFFGVQKSAQIAVRQPKRRRGVCIGDARLAGAQLKSSTGNHPGRGRADSAVLEPAQR